MTALGAGARLHTILLCGLLCTMFAAAATSAQAPSESAVHFTPAPPPGSIPAPQIPVEPPQPALGATEPAGVAGWFPDQGFVIKSGDDRFALRVGLQAAYRLSPYWRDGKSQDRHNFFVVRPIIAGHALRKWIRFWTSLELAKDTPYVLDSYIELQPSKKLGLRIGQQWSPISRHEYAGPQEIMFADWSPVADYFWAGRDKGITLLGTLLDERLDYYAGVYAGSPPRQAVSFHGSWVVNGRITINPMGAVAANESPYITSGERVPTRASFTLQASAANKELAQLTTNPSAFGSDLAASGERDKQQLGGADFLLQGPRYLLLSEFYVRRAEPDAQRSFRTIGFWGQFGYMLWSRVLELSARFNWLDASQRLSNDAGYSIEAQSAYYPFSNQNLTLKLRYGYGKQNTPGEDRLGPVRLLLPAGTNHLLTLQLMIAI